MSRDPGGGRSTCRRCGWPIAGRPGTGPWWHTGPQPRVSCRPADGGLGAATPTDPGSALRMLLLALLAAGIGAVEVYDDGFAICRPDDRSLVFVAGAFTGEQVAALLGVDELAIGDLRTTRRGGDAPGRLTHDLSTLGAARAWRHLASPGGLSDLYRLRVFDVEVGVHRHPDGVAVTVDGTAATGVLLVHVNGGRPVAYRRPHRGR